MFNSKTALLVGAGLSKPVGIPAMRGLAQSFRQSLRQEDETYDAYNFIRSLGVSEDVEDILQTIKLIRRYHNSKLENYMDKAIAPSGHSHTLSKTHRREQTNFEAIDSLEDSLLDYIRQTCFSFDRDGAVQTYSGLVDVLSNEAIPVFTTNYDFVLEHVATDNGHDVVDNFVEDNRGRQFWDPTLTAFKKHGFRIVKIHGSLQWYVDDTGRIEKIPFLAQMNPEGQSLQDLVIFPTRFKDIYERNYFALYSVLLRSLESIQLLVVTGHSLRDEYIRAAVRERVRRGNVTVVVIDPGQPLLEDIYDAADAGNPGSQVVQYDWDISEVAPLLADGLDQISVDKTIAYFDDADETLSSRRVNYDSIEVDSPPHWVSPGETLHLRVIGDITVGGGRFTVWLDLARNRSNRQELNWREVQSDHEELEGVIRGIRRIDSKIEIDLPPDLPRKGHGLGLGLVSSTDQELNVLVGKDYKVRTRSND